MEPGFVFMVEGKGYGGTVKGIVGIDADGIITGTKILSHSETPSLGGKTAEEPFQSQFPGKDSTLSGVSVISGRFGFFEVLHRHGHSGV